MALLPTSSFPIAIAPPQQQLRFVNEQGSRVRVKICYRGATQKMYETKELLEYGGPLNMSFNPLESHMS
jgi:hypothetical protein